MEWQQLLGFYQVARLGSFTKAAAATFRSQSALSQQVRALEAELDCLLLERLGHRLRLTPAGEKLLEFSRTLLAGYETFKEEPPPSSRGPTREPCAWPRPSPPCTACCPRRCWPTAGSFPRSTSPSWTAPRRRSWTW